MYRAHRRLALRPCLGEGCFLFERAPPTFQQKHYQSRHTKQVFYDPTTIAEKYTNPEYFLASRNKF